MKTRRFCCLLLATVLIAATASAADIDFSQMSNAQLIALDERLADVMTARGLYAYISPSGKKHHLKPTCSGMESTIRVLVDDLEACGYAACKRCYKQP